MKKYIDAESLKAWLVKTVVTIDPDLDDTAQAWLKGYNSALMNVAGWLDEMPAADVVEVIRCKDCTHYQFADNRAFGMPVKMCEWFGFEDVDDDDFCSRAERRTDDCKDNV